MTEPHRDLTIFGEADDATVEQMYNCLDVKRAIERAEHDVFLNGDGA